MLRMSKLTDYATVLLAHMAHDRRLSSAGELAEATQLAGPTVSKLLKTLAKAGLVDSMRGPQGGYTLARQPEDISAADIIDALEGPVAITECSAGAGHCDLEAVCHVGSAWQRINRGIRSALGEVSLMDLQDQPNPLPGLDLSAQARGVASSLNRA
jgi:FeS assembly SUF system regulator